MERKESVIIERDGRKVYESYMGIGGYDFLTVKWNACSILGILPTMEESLKDLTRSLYPCFRFVDGSIYTGGTVLYEAPTLWELLKLVHSSGYIGNGCFDAVDHNGVHVDCPADMYNGRIEISLQYDFCSDIYQAWSSYTQHLDYLKGAFTPDFQAESEAYAKELAQAFKEGRVYCARHDFTIPGVDGDFYLAD